MPQLLQPAFPSACFVVFPNTHCTSAQEQEDELGFVFFSFFFKLPLNSVSTKRDNGAADTATDALNDGLDRVHLAIV